MSEQFPTRPTGGREGYAVAALVLGIISVLIPLLTIPGVLAIIFGAMSTNTPRRAMAIWGLCLGIVGSAFVFWFFALASVSWFAI